MVHNLEETFGMEKWTNNIPLFIHPPVTTEQFAIAVGLFTVLGFITVFVIKKYVTDNQFAFIITGFAGMLFLNIFLPHLISTLLFKQYASGIITGILINLPLTRYILRTTFKMQKLNIKQIITTSIVGVLVGIVLAFTFLKIGETLTT